MTLLIWLFFFFKQKTAYDVRISDWSSDVCSSDLTKGPRGNTVHGLVNLIGVIGNTPVFDSAAWTVEMTWNTYTHVRSGETLFNAKGYASCAGKDKWEDRKSVV